MTDPKQIYIDIYIYICNIETVQLDVKKKTKRLEDKNIETKKCMFLKY